MVNRIALIDDNPKLRGKLARRVQQVLPSGWSLIQSPPLAELGDYEEWVVSEDVWSLILDWRLSDIAEDGAVDSAEYTAQELVSVIRRWRPDFPIFVITAYDIPSDRATLGEVEVFSGRIEFVKNVEQNIQRIVRASARFWKSHEDQLSRVSNLSQRAAVGKLTKKEKAELAALRISLNLTVVHLGDEIMELYDSAESAMAKVDETIARLEEKVGQG